MHLLSASNREGIATANVTYQPDPRAGRVWAIEAGRGHAEHALLRFPSDAMERSPFRKQQ
jgi:hypothetical protein